jgi:hypothetical protein
MNSQLSKFHLKILVARNIMIILSRFTLQLILIALFSAPANSQAASNCSEQPAGAKGICNAHCESLDCTDPGNTGSAACNSLKSQYMSATGGVPLAKKLTVT